MPYETNRFCWHGLVTTDPAKAAAFYPEVLGWKTVTQQMGDSESTLFAANGEPHCHYMEPPMPDVPSHWNNYLRVDDVDASAAAAAANGGAIQVPGTDVPPGRFAVVTAPSGAALSLFHEADPASDHHPGGNGSPHWTELHSLDIESDVAWLKETFGFETSGMTMPQGGTYHLLNHGGQTRGGACKAFFEGAPSMWLTWFQIDDCDAAVARVKSNGGDVHSEPVDYPGVGRMSVVADPTGAVFGIIQPAEQLAV